MPSSYNKRETNEGLILEVSPMMDFPKPWGLFTFQAIMMAIMLAVSFWLIVLVAPLAYWMYHYYFKSKLVTYHRVPATIKVSADSIEASGKKFQFKDINRLLIRNIVDEKGTDTGYMSASGTQEAGRMVERSRLRKLREVSYYISIESMGQAYTIAGGLQEATAFAIVDEINKFR